MSRGRDAVQRAFDRLGKEGGFTRYSGQLVKESDDVAVVLELQRSDYGRSYYINVGFGLTLLQPTAVRTMARCDIRVRAEQILPEESGEVRQLLNLDDGADDSTRETDVHRLLRERLLPAIEEAMSIEGLRRLQQTGRLTGFARKGALDLLRNPKPN